MKSKDNPYDWAGQSRHYVPRKGLLSNVKDFLLDGKHGYVLGCRGMGKSSFMRELMASLKGESLEVLHFPRPPMTLAIDRACRMIGDEIDRRCEARGTSSTSRREMQRYAEQENLEALLFGYIEELERNAPNLDRLVLLLDELDGYARPNPSTGQPWGESFINNLEDARKRSEGKLVIFAAGGLSVAALDSIFVSPFFSRATREILEPFDIGELIQLAHPYRDRGTPLCDEVIETIRIMSGGNPALATYALEKLWNHPSPTPADVSSVMDQMRDKDGDIPDGIRTAIFDGSTSNGPAMVWKALEKSGGKLSNRELKEIIMRSTRQRANEAKWIFRMLRTSGLVRAKDDAYRLDPVQVEIIPSLITLDIGVGLDECLPTKATLREQLIADLEDILARIHRMSIDFFTIENKIVPESVFSATLALGLGLRGWHVEREANSAAGRTDIKASLDRFGKAFVVVEVKIWPRNDYKDIHDQVVGYWSGGIEALATVMVADLQGDDWPKKYMKECLEGKTPRHVEKLTSPSLAGHFVAETQRGQVTEVDHLLLRLAKKL